MPIFTDDRPLLDAFRVGDRSALETVYNHYVKDIVMIAKHGFTVGSGRVPPMPNADDQRDVVQETFVKAFMESARLSYDGLRPYGPFVCRIARNLMIDRARKSGREVPTDIDDARLGDPPPAESTVEEALHFKRLRIETETYLADQPEPVQQFVRLRFVEGLSQAQVAAAMGVTRRRVRTLEETAMGGLSKHLKTRGLSW